MNDVFLVVDFDVKLLVVDGANQIKYIRPIRFISVRRQVMHLNLCSNHSLIWRNIPAQQFSRLLGRRRWFGETMMRAQRCQRHFVWKLSRSEYNRMEHLLEEMLLLLPNVRYANRKVKLSSVGVCFYGL